MASKEAFQLSTEAAELYEQAFVPALFREWAEYLVDVAKIAPGSSVLDVGCGTGVVARIVAERQHGRGRVAGIDLNEGMLAVARRIRPDIEWHHGDAGDLPFPADSFDAVLSQAALMYFPDRVKALGEMARVVAPEGSVAVLVWGSLEEQPAYRVFADVIARHAGDQGNDVIDSYFCLGDLELVRSLFDEAGLEVTETHTRMGRVRFGSIDEFVKAEIESTPLIERIDGNTYGRILDDCRGALAAYVTEPGEAEVPIQGHVIVGRAR